MQRLSSLVKAAVIAASISVVLHAQCLPLTPGPFNVNGIVVGRALNSGGTHTTGPCGADLGWGGVPANTLVPLSGGSANTFSAQLFTVGIASGANLDRLYLGLHVENDDKVSPGDIFVVYVDANNNGAFDAGDFALKFEVGPLATPTTEDCNKSVNNSAYFTFNGGKWTQAAFPATAVKAALSYDYDANMPDTESNLWELEVEINPSALGLTIPIAQGVGMAGKVWIDQSNNAIPPVPLVFPSAFNMSTGDALCAAPGTDQTVCLDEQPVDPDFKTQLAKLQIGTCGFDVVINSISGSNHLGQEGHIDRGYPNPIVGTPANQSSFKATVQLVNPANPGDTSNLAVPDVGTVNFVGRPWYAGDFHGTFNIGSPQSVQFTAVGQTQVVGPFKWPANEAEYAPARPMLDNNQVDHACLQVSLSSFTVNSNPNDLAQENLVFTHASTIKDRFVIASRRQEGPGGINTYYVRALWGNLPASYISDPSQPPQPGKWAYRFTNAAAIGLKDLGGGWYSIDMKPNEERVVEVELTGGTMTYPVRRFKLGGVKPVVLQVKPGMTVTVVGSGLVNVDPAKYKTPTGPDGFSEREAQGKYLLTANSGYLGRQNIGAIIASFDGFKKTSFLVGGLKTFIVPDGVSSVSFAVNDLIGKSADNKGAFDVNVVLTPALGLPTRTARPGNPHNGQPAVPDLGSSLPRLNVDMNLLAKDKKYLIPTSNVILVLYDSHPQ